MSIVAELFFTRSGTLGDQNYKQAANNWDKERFEGRLKTTEKRRQMCDILWKKFYNPHFREVFFQAKEKKLEIFIKHPKYEPRPIELGSGAEKTIAAMGSRGRDL